MKFEIWSNVSSRRDRFFTGYDPADTMKKSWEDVLNLSPNVSVSYILEKLFQKFNQDDRPNGQTAHSLSIGDVVVLDGKAYAVGTIGFRELPTFQPTIGDYK